MPNYAQAQQVSKTDDRIKASYETVPSPHGNGSIKGYLVRPVSADTRAETVSKLPGIIVVHENRGLNPHIEDVARRLALVNFMAFAPDGLTSLGGFPGDDFKGGQMFTKVDGKKMGEDFVASAAWLKSRADCSGKIGATGFCYGGGVANTLAVRLGPDLGAAVPFYGAVPSDEDIPKIKGAIFGPSRSTRHATRSDVAGVRQGLNGGKRSARRLYLSERCSRFSTVTRRRKLASQQSSGRLGLAAHG